MNITFYLPDDSDEMVVNRARRRIALMTKWRWGVLAYGIGFLALATFCTVAVIRKLELLEAQQLTGGFAYGVALGVTWVTLGTMGGLCVGKFMAGCQKDFREPQLLVRYYDRLRELGELPEKDGNAK
jgi:hypothetical protein